MSQSLPEPTAQLRQTPPTITTGPRMSEGMVVKTHTATLSSLTGITRSIINPPLVPIDTIAQKNYNYVHIELENSSALEKLYDTIKEKGDTKIKISFNEVGKNYLFELKEKRKFDGKTFKYLNKERFIKKITV